VVRYDDRVARLWSGAAAARRLHGLHGAAENDGVAAPEQARLALRKHHARSLRSIVVVHASAHVCV
jgi:hypothetical protein